MLTKKCVSLFMKSGCFPRREVLAHKALIFLNGEDSSRVGVRESCVIPLVRRRRSWNSTGSVGRRKMGDEERESEQRWEKTIYVLRALALLHALISLRPVTHRSQPISHGNQ